MAQPNLNQSPLRGANIRQENIACLLLDSVARNRNTTLDGWIRKPLQRSGNGLAHLQCSASGKCKGLSLPFQDDDSSIDD